MVLLCVCAYIMLHVCVSRVQTGPFVKLLMGQETSFYADTEPPTHCFCPCAHMASESTVKYVAYCRFVPYIKYKRSPT